MHKISDKKLTNYVFSHTKITFVDTRSMQHEIRQHFITRKKSIRLHIYYNSLHWIPTMNIKKFNQKNFIFFKSKCIFPNRSKKSINFQSSKKKRKCRFLKIISHLDQTKSLDESAAFIKSRNRAWKKAAAHRRKNTHLEHVFAATFGSNVQDKNKPT